MKIGAIVREEGFKEFNSLIHILHAGLFNESRLRLFVDRGSQLVRADCVCCYHFGQALGAPVLVFKSDCAAGEWKMLVSHLNGVRRMPGQDLGGSRIFTGKELAGLDFGEWGGFFMDIYNSFWDHRAPGHYLFSAIQQGNGCGMVIFRRDAKNCSEFGAEEKEIVTELCPHLDNYLKLRLLTALWHQQGGASSFLQAWGVSKREAEVAVLTMKGRSISEICQRLEISQETVRDHLKNIYRKLEIHSKAELVSWYIRLWERSMKEALGKSLEWD